MAITVSIFTILIIPVVLITVMSIAEYHVTRKFKLWGLIIPITSCILSFLVLLFLIGAIIQFIIFIVIYRKQKKEDEMAKMNIQDL